MNWKSYLRSPVLLYPSIFTLKIFVFAGFYYLAFSAFPDSFRFGAGYNVTPLTGYFDGYFRGDGLANVADSDVGEDLALLQSKAGSVQSAFVEWQETLTKERLVAVERDEAIVLLVEAIENGVLQYEVEHIEPLKRRILTTENSIKKLAIGSQDVIVIRQALVQMQEELLTHYDVLLRDRLRFAPSEFSGARVAAENKLELVRREATEAEDHYIDLRNAFDKVVGATRSQILEKIGFADFFYFSACISTTTTFGDITANKRWLRLVVTFQIVLGIFILAKMLEAFSRQN